MGAGKTTAIRSISDREPVSTEMPISDEVTSEKTHTTVALDYSSVELETGELLHLYGVPGQGYLDFMWPMVAEGALGIVVLVNAQQADRVDSTAHLLQRFGALAPQACFAVGVTRTDLTDGFALATFRDALLERGYRIPVMRMDARQPIQVDFLIKTLLSYQYARSLPPGD
ncbi:GTP-binding protein [Luteimonas deserti]|uniref:ATP/GTP-binding protein n=1 Tax=Luteimonas deserti TaxID=2752306 RepID=A0A7Z0QRU3_9GAMM|nr:ATP/GTP-binding protein [Luteimonas deserti]NYZ63702.1 ATP/GTP-binding protein [Luteimonas deserti]